MSEGGALRVGIVVVAYEAEGTIVDVLDRIPATVAGRPPWVLVADDCSDDGTAKLAREWAARSPLMTEIAVRDHNLGYGGNQKACYRWAIEQSLDIVVLLHGDGQYPPERLDDVVAPIVSGDADFVFGSRMIERGGARAGGMPLSKRVGNPSLTFVLNRFGRSRLSEWFSGFRAYRVSALAEAAYASQPDGFDFDTAITFRFLERGFRISEISIPTRYAGEVSRVPLVRTGLQTLRHGAASTRWRWWRSDQAAALPAGSSTV